MKYFIANWKMHGDTESISEYCLALNSLEIRHPQQCILALPAPLLPIAKKLLPNNAIQLAAQCVSQYASGAYTGDISATMYSDIGCQFALIGHSERRAIESIPHTCNQITQCISTKIQPILCIGESAEEKANLETKAVISAQIEPCLKLIQGESKLILAYEPRWAIGSGLTPSQDEIMIVTSWLKESYGCEVLYGGSVNDTNLAALGKTGIDGVLVGGASLDSKQTISMVKTCTQYF